MKKFFLPLAFLLISICAISQNPLLLKDVYPGVTGSGIQQIVKTSNYTFFNAEDDDADADRGLYRTDGTPGGTIKLNLTYPTYNSTKAEKLTALGNKIIFAGDNIAPYYGEVWASDGTQAGTIALERFQPSLANSRGPVFEMAALNGYVYYGVVASNNKTQLRRTDGTVAGTSLVYEFSSYTTAPELGLLKNINGVLYFNMYDANGAGNDMTWRSDGTAAGTYMLRDLGTEYFAMGFFMEPVNGAICFMTGKFDPIDFANSKAVLFKTDGTPAGTVPLYEFAGTYNNNLYPAYAIIGSTLYFTASETLSGKELWKTDGTTGGTMLAADIMAGAASSIPLNLTNFNNQLYFSARISNVYKFYKLEGGTPVMVKDIILQNGNNGNSAFVISNNNLVFNATSATSGAELWISDGTTANTLQVADINPGVASSAPLLLTPGTSVYFSANNGVNGAEIFKYDNSGGINGLHKIYVNDNSTAGDIYTSAVGSNTNAGTSVAPVATINYAISIAQAGDIIMVDAGLYAEAVVVNKSLYFKGAQAGNCPGSLLTRGAETIIVPPVVNNLAGNLILVQAANVTIDGFTLDGDNPLLTSSLNMNGANVDGFSGITNNTVANMTVKNNIIKNLNRNGIGMAGAAVTYTIDCNHIDNLARIANVMGIGAEARGINTSSNAYGVVTNNYITRTVTGMIILSFNTAGSVTPSFANNTVTSYQYGMLISVASGTAVPFAISSNTFSTADYASWVVSGQTNFPTNRNNGININNQTLNTALNLTNNNISGANTGILASGLSGPLFRVNGGTISNSTGIGIFYDGYMTTPKLKLENVSLADNAVGMDVSYSAGPSIEMEFSGTSVTGGNVGIRYYGNALSFTGNTLSGINFSNQSQAHIYMTSHAFEGQTIDASGASFNGVVAANMTLAQLFATEDKLIHKIDFDSIGYFKLKPTEVFVTVNSFAADLPPVFGTPTTTPNINRAVGAAAPGDVINVGAGTYINQVTIDKGITLKGAGSALTSILTPAVTVPPPGTFTEKGVIQTTQNIGDVYIEGLSITGDYTNNITPLIIQTGGHVKNCKLQNGNQGVFIRIESAVKTAVVENNLINAEYVGVNVEGLGLTATLANNTINVNNTDFSSGVFAGQDFGSLPQFTATGNIITNYAFTGLSVNSLNASITQNSIVGINGFAIQRTGGNLPNATCNWFGTNDVAMVASKISGTVTYSPWLTEGTDTDVAPGFQPAPGTCTGRQNKFYVNNNSLTGDVFTTAVGNNANNGLPASPFATPDYAYSIAQPGDTIYVDAGTFDLGGLTYSFPKAMVFLGTNYLVSPNDPANKLLANAGRNAESVLANGKMLIAGNGLSMEGFTWDVGNRTGVELVNIATTNNDFGNFKFTKNIFKITHTNVNLNSFSITGKFVTSPALPITSGYTIEDNRFEKSGSVSGTTFNFSFVKNITVTNNSFVLTGATPRTQNVLTLGNTGLVDQVIFSNNTLDQSNTIVGGNRIAAVNVSANKIYNCGSAFSMNNVMAESSNIDVSNNLMENTTGNSPFILYTRNGGGLSGSSSIFKSEGNTMTSFASPGSGQLYGSFNITVNNSVQNPNVIIRGNNLYYSGDFSTVESQYVRAISLRGKIENATIENNEMTFNNSTSLLPVPTTLLLPENPGISLITEFGATLYIPSNAVINILNNKVKGFKQSVVLFDGTTGAGARDTYTGYGNLAAGAVVNINNNSFTTDEISINNGNVGQSVNATCNWYGSSAEQNVSPKITETSVNYTPWLTNGTDNNPAVGFQPVANSCNGVPVDADIILVTNVTCYGAANGSIDALVEEGVAPFTYAWSKDGIAGYSNSEDINDLAPGLYQLIVTDANGSTDTAFATITQPNELVSSAIGNNVSCFGNSNGTASVNATGGIAPYTYLWSNAATTNSIGGLVAGNYTVTVTDANGCTTTASYTVTQPTALAVVISGTNANCFGNSNGTATANATGGTAPYTYLWSNAATTNSIGGLVAGNYTVTVTDANGCTTTGSYTVTQPTVLTVVMSGTNANCSGSATATPAGGTAPYAYLWSNGATTQTINGVPNGTYTVIVTDAKNCIVSGSRNVNGNSSINPTASVINVNCFGQSTGSITVTGAGGVAPRIYNINGGSFQASNVFTGLPAAVYVIGAKDANGCVDFVTKTVTQPAAALTVALDSTRASCFATNNGRVYITANGGSGATNYNWTGPNGYTSNTQDPNNLFGGTYNVLVTDAKGCTAGLSAIVIERAAITISEVITNVSCRGDLTGAINATATGGSGSGFTYKWTGPNGFLATTEDVTGIKAGNYTFTVTDIVNGCTAVKVIIVTQPATNIDLATAKTNVAGCNNLGTITATGSGGTSPYQYKLDNGSYQASGLFTNLYGSTYTVWVKDANGCTTTKVVTITDNGTDQYEGNNTKNQAKLITISSLINARIANAGDAADWFKFVTPAGTGNYILSFTHPSVSFTFNMYAAGNNTPALVPVSTTATSKQYVLSGNATYYISITGGLSYTCYDLMVSPPTSFGETITITSTETTPGSVGDAIIKKAKPVVTDIPNLLAKAYPNPHQGKFNLQIKSPEAGTAKIELFSVNGQKIQEKTMSVQKGVSTIISLQVAQYGTIFYRVQIGNYTANGKVIGTN